MRPVTETGSPLMKERTLVRKLGVHEVPLSKLKKAAHAGGGALSDAFVAGIAGGLRRYHEAHDVQVGDLHLTMPISVRAEDDGQGRQPHHAGALRRAGRGGRPGRPDRRDPRAHHQGA